MTSSATSKVNITPVNDPHTGGVTITGTATQNQTLTANNDLGDVDGLGTIHYQWQADGKDITGATGSTFVLGQAEVGHKITVVASYTDLGGSTETSTSSETGLVSNVNDAPVGEVTITGEAKQGQTLTASNNLTDADGIPSPGSGSNTFAVVGSISDGISYQWQVDGHDIVGATGMTLLLDGSEVGKAITVVASYMDGHGTFEHVSSSPTSFVIDSIVHNVYNGTSHADLLTGTAGDDVLNGLGGIDILYGGAGNDILDGGSCADMMIGGTGNDIYVVDNKLDIVIELHNGGTDLVKSSITYTLGENVENLTLTGSTAINGTGNELDNIITGNSGNNILSGGAGNDSLFGDAGNDILIGGAGADTLTGGEGNDIFRYTSQSESGTTALTMDVITDFVSGKDKIDLSGIDANIKVSGNQAFSSFQFGIGPHSFTAPGQLWFDTANGILYGNTNSDPLPEFAITLTGLHSLSASDIIM
ncbi:MAG: M10 family metallopeptidase C-terminal domain-containing protein [Chlorobiales bacterium]|nr:M10 family metallopeptidase C-terminal domain-containing protein [Chlorobiales bacterium]